VAVVRQNAAFASLHPRDPCSLPCAMGAGWAVGLAGWSVSRRWCETISPLTRNGWCGLPYSPDRPHMRFFSAANRCLVALQASRKSTR
jgi:hypothetical protein